MSEAFFIVCGVFFSAVILASDKIYMEYKRRKNGKENEFGIPDSFRPATFIPNCEPIHITLKKLEIKIDKLEVMINELKKQQKEG